MQPREVWKIHGMHGWLGRMGLVRLETVCPHGAGEGGRGSCSTLHKTAVLQQLPVCHILIKPQLQAELVQGSLVTPCVTGALMTPDVPAKDFYHIVFSQE